MMKWTGFLLLLYFYDDHVMSLIHIVGKFLRFGLKLHDHNPKPSLIKQLCVFMYDK